VILGWIALIFSALGVLFAMGGLINGLGQGSRALSDTIQYFVIAMLPPLTALIVAILLLGLGEQTELMLEVLESNDSIRKALESGATPRRER
jgi:hypothetical protein